MDVDSLVDMIWDLADRVPVQLRADVVDRAFELVELHGVGACAQVEELFQTACEESSRTAPRRPRRVLPVNAVHDYRRTKRPRPRPAAASEEDGCAPASAPAQRDGEELTRPEPPNAAAQSPFSEQATDPRFVASPTYHDKLARDVEVVSGDGADFSDSQRTQTAICSDRNKPRKRRRKGRGAKKGTI
jgi:hypothetical protein